MIDTPKENREKFPPELAEIISRFKRLSITPARDPPFVVLEWPTNTE